VVAAILGVAVYFLFFNKSGFGATNTGDRYAKLIAEQKKQAYDRALSIVKESIEYQNYILATLKPGNMVHDYIKLLQKQAYGFAQKIVLLPIQQQKAALLGSFPTGLINNINIYVKQLQKK
jgi:hypothetical protein